MKELEKSSIFLLPSDDFLHTTASIYLFPLLLELNICSEQIY